MRQLAEGEILNSASTQLARLYAPRFDSLSPQCTAPAPIHLVFTVPGCCLIMKLLRIRQSMRSLHNVSGVPSSLHNAPLEFSTPGEYLRSLYNLPTEIIEAPTKQ